MVESSNVSSSVVQEGVNGHVSQLPNGHVSQFSNGHVSQLPNGHVSQLFNGHVSQLPNGHAAHLLNEHVSQSPRERLVVVLDFEDWGDVIVDFGIVRVFAFRTNVEKAVRLCLMMKETEVKIAEKNISSHVSLSIGVDFCFKMPNVSNRFLLIFKDRLLIVFNEEVGGDVAVIREYRGIACGLRICMGRREECIRELKALGDREGVAETVRFIEGLQADDMDRCNHTLALMTEVEVKAREKSRFILKLSGYEVD
ncbi:hypothetical protein Tco_0722143 [Tanacetum coccineum]